MKEGMEMVVTAEPKASRVAPAVERSIESTSAASTTDRAEATEHLTGSRKRRR